MGENSCNELKLATLDSALLLDLKDYAQLVIDLATESKVEGPFSVTLNQMKLVSGRKIPYDPIKPELKNN